ncbi:chitin-binding protein [Streptomyces sp. NPDC021749]|uniref:chitin-binding protein n=1 Tax=Streptomyces sp. NPDC021749 TaxID=3154905 RepID=UPI0033D5AC51
MRRKTALLGAVALTGALSAALAVSVPPTARATTGTIIFHMRPGNRQYQIVDPGDDHCYGLGPGGGEVVNDTPLDLVLWSSRDCTGNPMATVRAGTDAVFARYGSLQLVPSDDPGDDEPTATDQPGDDEDPPATDPPESDPPGSDEDPPADPPGDQDPPAAENPPGDQDPPAAENPPGDQDPPAAARRPAAKPSSRPSASPASPHLSRPTSPHAPRHPSAHSSAAAHPSRHSSPHAARRS